MAKAAKRTASPARPTLLTEFKVGGGYQIAVFQTGRQYFFNIRHKNGKRPVTTSETYTRQRTAEQQVLKLLAALRPGAPVLEVVRIVEGARRGAYYKTLSLPKLEALS
jgi:hypothetical protein